MPVVEKTPRPLFLERPSYRRRRMADAAFLLPVFGGLLFCAPTLWSVPQEAAPGVEPVSTSGAIVYLFGAWFTLILGAVLFGRLVRGWAEERAPDGAGAAASGEARPGAAQAQRARAGQAVDREPDAGGPETGALETGASGRS